MDYVSHSNPHVSPICLVQVFSLPVSRRDVHTPGLPASIPCHPHPAWRRSGLYYSIPTSKSMSINLELVAQMSTLEASYKLALPHLLCMDPAQRPWVAGVLNGSFSLHSTRQCGPPLPFPHVRQPSVHSETHALKLRLHGHIQRLLVLDCITGTTWEQALSIRSTFRAQETDLYLSVFAFRLNPASSWPPLDPRPVEDTLPFSQARQVPITALRASNSTGIRELSRVQNSLSGAIVTTLLKFPTCHAQEHNARGPSGSKFVSPANVHTHIFTHGDTIASNIDLKTRLAYLCMALRIIWARTGSEIRLLSHLSLQSGHKVNGTLANDLCPAERFEPNHVFATVMMYLQFRAFKSWERCLVAKRPLTGLTVRREQLSSDVPPKSWPEVAISEQNVRCDLFSVSDAPARGFCLGVRAVNHHPILVVVLQMNAPATRNGHPSTSSLRSPGHQTRDHTLRPVALPMPSSTGASRSAGSFSSFSISNLLYRIGLFHLHHFGKPTLIENLNLCRG
ncbi:uncharacterized protein CLUP02_05509 [Colletotrichum lupini]|uniref:Uncharacterized protein n=1 Tax=Colletotrichum lupini TaxID=145971 RepID=A0A9Q8SMX1_9PEZI|nr:uncharacterized protein CLUP02_05509 [Colletotrichum lupini]UQC80028.1 hypothetical protein CLUP02_05509 [Colletotrichum lupini]